MTDTLLNILQYTVPALLVFITVYFVFRNQSKKEIALKEYELRKMWQKNTLPLRLQAYERLALLLERIHFSNLIPRVRRQDMTVRELRQEMISQIKMEYEHNLAQQIYVSGELWHLVTLCKDELIKTINLVASGMPQDESGSEFSKALFRFILENEEDLPNERVLAYLKNEVKSLF